jgi:hypothetical protein
MLSFPTVLRLAEGVGAEKDLRMDASTEPAIEKAALIKNPMMVGEPCLPHLRPYQNQRLACTPHDEVLISG